MAVIMPEKRIFPLKNPPQEKDLHPPTYSCKYCKWVGGGRTALDYHLNHYHEAELAKDGNKSSKEGGGKWKSYIECYWIKFT